MSRIVFRALTLACAPATLLLAQDDDANRPPRRVVPMDSARSVLLYVSNRPEDHPEADYARAVAAKARTDSIYLARGAGVMRVEKRTVQSRHGDLQIPVYVFAPLTPVQGRQRPAMIWVHGGVHGTWDPQYLPFVIEATQRGYVIVAPDYRGSTGYGEAFHRAIDYGGKEVDDVEDVLQLLAAHPEVDTTRVGIMGWSHGGLITSLLMMRGAKTRFQAGAAIVPVTNLLFRLSYKGPSYQRNFSTQAGLRGLPFEQRAEYLRRSPYYHVDSLTRPLLVHIASNDTDVNFEEARPLVDALIARKSGLAEPRIYWNPTPGPTSVGHTFSRRVNRTTYVREDSPEQVDSWTHVWDFFSRSLRPKP